MSDTLTPTEPRVLVRRPLRSPERAEAAQHQRRAVEIILGLAVPVLLLGLWQLASRSGWIDRRLYPSPSTVLHEAWSMLTDGELWKHVAATTRRILLAFGFGALAGFVVGAVMGVARIARASLEPLLNGLYVVPKLALLPVYLTIFGLGELTQVVFVATTVFFFVWIATMEAFSTIPEGYREAARSLQVSPARMFTDVLLPAALPQLFVALRIAMGVAVLVIVPTEFVVSDKGLGYLIFHSHDLFIQRQMFVGIITIAVEGVVLTGIVSWIGRRLTPWAPSRGARTVT
ncbi:MAG: putative taurine transport system permease protein [Acidimicrobiia bacterium]|nr:putative taurine transport system permease protein [Acidimicrobiia bacterium]